MSPSDRDADVELVVVAASAGGLQPLRALLSALPANLPAALLVVLHVPATGGHALPRILDRSGPLHAASAVDGEPIRRGRVYVAPPDRHLLVVKDTVRALWLAVRALDERGKLVGRLASEAGERGHRITADQFTVAAREARESADAIREVVSGMLAEVVLRPGTRAGTEADPGAVPPSTKPA